MRILAIVALISACASPAPEMFGASRSEVSMDGIRFVVFHQGDRAEVIRMGYLSRPDRARVPALMAAAAERATGCRVRQGSVRTRLPGDTGEARMRLDCP